MNRRPPRPLHARAVAWAMAFALLLQAAVPMLASAAAGLQGKTVADVCTVYGVTTVALSEVQADHDGETSQPSHAAAGSGGHCALTALFAFTPPALPVAGVASADTAAGPWPEAGPRAPDACAAWVARLEHGPPARA
jgi:hypothetical protein